MHSPFMPLLFVSNISKKYTNSFSLNGVSFTQDSNEKIAIIGESGSGKSTLVKIIAGHIQPDLGEVKFNNQHVLGPHEQLIPGHKHIAYLSQHYELRNNYTVSDLLDYGSEMTAVEADEIFKLCHITHLLQRKTNDGLSGGEKQRIAVAKLLLTKPELLLLDEPFSNLDLTHKNKLKTLLADLELKLKVTCLLISHDPLDVLSWADKIIVMQSGKIVQSGSPKHIYYHPVSTYVAALFGPYNLIHPNLLHSSKPLPALDYTKKQLFIRPEQLMLDKNNSDHNIGIIQQNLFMGNHYKIIVKINDVLLEIITGNHQFEVGDQITISLPESDLWFI